MNKNSVKTRIEEFWQNNRNAIVFGVGCAVGSYIGYKYTMHRITLGICSMCSKNPGLEETLIKAMKNTIESTT